jgi:hypothetical protein
LSDDFANASPEEMDEALFGVLESMSPAEAFNFTKALQQISKGAGQALSDPVVGQIVRTALPIVGGAAGTVIGGPLGTALGSSLGTAAAAALPGGKPMRPTTPAPTPPASAVSGGSPAAAKGLVLTQQPDVLKSLLAVAMGQKGQQSVNGIPVAAVMNMLSNVFGQAAADADELSFLAGEGADEASDAFLDEEGHPDSQSLYTRLMDAENVELAESEDW